MGKMWSYLMELLDIRSHEQLKECMETENDFGKYPKKIHSPCPESKANLFSLICYSWMTRLIWKGYKRPLEDSDLYSLPERYQIKRLSSKFDPFWKSEMDNSLKGGTASLKKALYKTFYPRILLAGLIKLISVLILIYHPYQVEDLIASITVSPDAPVSTSPSGFFASPLFYALMLSLLSIVYSFSTIYYEHLVRTESVAVESVLESVIYRKSLKLSTYSKQVYSSGKIMNFISTDAYHIGAALNVLHGTWSSIVTIIIFIYSLFSFLGRSAIAGILILFIFIPFQVIFVKRMNSLYLLLYSFTDKRVDWIRELLSNIRLIKYYAWERAFHRVINLIRNSELAKNRQMLRLKALLMTIIFSSSLISSIASFVMYTTLGYNLTASIAFPSMALFMLLKGSLSQVPNIITVLLNASISMKRLSLFFQAEEATYEPTLKPDLEYGMVMRNAEFIWDEFFEDEENQSLLTEEEEDQDLDEGDYLHTSLKNINLSIPRGSFVAVIGPVGSGKSSLLRSLIGEMRYVSGEVYVSGSIGYCPQQAWILNGTVRENILFGEPFEKERYMQVVKACALEDDLETFANGDKTLIGEKGVTLSGGQKQRISLARLVYYQRDIYLLDDPLSAVDSHVGRHLFEKCLSEYLDGKTRILVTHHIQWLPKVDYIIFMKDGAIQSQGTYDLLINDPQDRTLYNFINKFRKPVDTSIQPLAKHHHGHRKSGSVQTDLKLKDDSISKRLSVTERDFISSGKTDLLIEEREIGAVALKYYILYIKECGGLKFCFLALLTLIILHCSRIACDIWVTVITNTSESGQPDDGKGIIYLLLLYGLFGLLNMIFLIISSLVFLLGSLKAATRFHEAILCSILKTQIFFFDDTPSGRILSRFSKDMDAIDFNLIEYFHSFGLSVSALIGTIIVICVYVPYFVLVLVPSSFIYWIILKLYRPTGRELNRLLNLSRSPVYAHISETLHGLSTIRNYRKDSLFIKIFEPLLDDSKSPAFLCVAGEDWMTLRIRIIGNVLSLVAILICLLERNSGSTIGLVLSYTLSLFYEMDTAFHSLVQLESNMNSVERIDFYATKLPWESPNYYFDSQAIKNKKDYWKIQEGKIEFKDVSLKYKPSLPPSLSSLSMIINPKEKIGIVGRTGAGKSSIMSLLFRLIEPFEGAIYIDDHNIHLENLHLLRQQLSIIPQDPVVFSNTTLRFNLDPLDQYTDSDLWIVLEKVHLKPFVMKNMDGNLDYWLSGGGSEVLSQGQKQLLALARAFLRKSKILILDEATSNIDLELDYILQSILRTEMNEITVLTIAHRISTIMDYDRVLVMDRGKAVEMDSPKKLLTNPESYFYHLVASSEDNQA